MATFAWEEERISNEDIKRYLTEYLAITAAKLASPVSPPSTSAGTPESSSPPLVPTSVAPALSPSPPLLSQDSASSSSGWFSWLWPSPSSTPNNIHNAAIVAVESTSTTSQKDGYWWNWMTGWVWSTPAETSLESRNEAVNVCMPEHSHKEPDLSSQVVEEPRQAAENLQLLKYLQAKQEETAARRSQVDKWKETHVGPRRMAVALDRAKEKASSFLKEKALKAQFALSKHSTRVSTLDDSLPGTSLVDLACIGGATDFYESPSDTVDSYKLLMGVDRVTNESELNTTGKKVKGTLLDAVFSKFESQESLGEAVHSNLGYLQEELLFEGLIGSPPQLTDSSVVDETIRKGVELCRGAISRIHAKLRLDAGSGHASNRTPNFSPRLETDVGLSVCWGDSGQTLGEVRLVLLTEEQARKLFVPSSSSVANFNGAAQEHPTDPLAGWECINKNSNYVAYRKLHGDTGLYQYKVIGQFDDITAKDFLDVQVDHETRKNWDTYTGELVVKETDELSGCKLIHWIMKYPFPMAHREYLFVQRVWTSDNNDLIVMMNKGVSHPDVRPGHSYVRVTDYYSNMVIQATSSIHQQGLRFELNYFENPHSNLPSSCVNWVTFSALPDFMSNVHTAAAAALSRRSLQ